MSRYAPQQNYNDNDYADNQYGNSYGDGGNGYGGGYSDEPQAGKYGNNSCRCTSPRSWTELIMSFFRLFSTCFPASFDPIRRSPSRHVSPRHPFLSARTRKQQQRLITILSSIYNAPPSRNPVTNRTDTSRRSHVVGESLRLSLLAKRIRRSQEEAQQVAMDRSPDSSVDRHRSGARWRVGHAA